MEPKVARGSAHHSHHGRRDRLGELRIELHMLRIAHAPGPAGDVARAIELAELDDLLARSVQDPDRWDLPPYAWARRHIAGAMEDAWTPS